MSTGTPRYAQTPTPGQSVNLRRSEPASTVLQDRGGGGTKDKDKGTWMGRGLRRLSMPLNAFNSSTTDVTTPNMMEVPEQDERVRRRSYEKLPGPGQGTVAGR